jgi:hypothetical protein
MNNNKYNNIEKTIFILPYRDRYNELLIWLDNMIPILDEQFNCYNISSEDKPYEVVIPHQKDERLFNKGGLINSMIQILLHKYKANLNNFTMVMNDIDIVCTKPNIFDYKVNDNIARHPYGVLRPKLGGILGGIFYMKFKDYLKVNGMPNYWGWGGEDITLANRCKAHNITIDETNFIERRSHPYILDPESHPDIKKQKLNIITDKRNLRSCFLENHKNPHNGITSCNYELLDEYYVNKYEMHKNVKIYDIYLNIL